MNREHRDRILIWLRDALFPLDFAKGLRFLTGTLPFVARSNTCPLPGKELRPIRREKALSDLSVDELPSHQTLRFLVSVSAVITVFCSSVAIIQPQTAFRLRDVRLSPNLSITENLSNFGLSLIADRGRLLLRESRFHVDRAGASQLSGFPGSLLYNVPTILKLNSGLCNYFQKTVD